MTNLQRLFRECFLIEPEFYVLRCSLSAMCIDDIAFPPSDHTCHRDTICLNYSEWFPFEGNNCPEGVFGMERHCQGWTYILTDLCVTKSFEIYLQMKIVKLSFLQIINNIKNIKE